MIFPLKKVLLSPAENLFSAVTSGIKEIKEVMVQAEQNRKMGIRTLLFADESSAFPSRKSIRLQ